MEKYVGKNYFGWKVVSKNRIDDKHYNYILKKKDKFTIYTVTINGSEMKTLDDEERVFVNKEKLSVSKKFSNLFKKI